MKKLITLSSIFIITSVLFTSCRSNMSVTKRHYNNGYYITNTKAKQTNSRSAEEERVAKKEVKKTVEPSKVIIEENDKDSYFNQNPIMANSDVVASTEKVQDKKISKSIAMKRLRDTAIEAPASQVKHIVSQAKNIRTYTAEGDGLSLFWIIILVLLILWAIGFISSGFLIGSVINLLLLVALILLILWLLRIL